MNHSTLNRRELLSVLAALACAPAAHAAPSAPPGDSLYQLRAPLVDQDGRAFELSSLQGTPVLASMFYTSCEMVCPMIFETIHSTLNKLAPAERDATRVLMVSFDPARDTVAVLKKTAQAHGCDTHWTLARAEDKTAREIAAVLGIQYRKLSNGEFNHSTTTILLDSKGRITARSGKLGGADPALVKALHQVHAAG